MAFACVGVSRYDAVRLLLELPHDIFMSTLKSASSDQKRLSEEATFFVVEKLDTIARLRGDTHHSAGGGTEPSALDGGSPPAEANQGLVVQYESDAVLDGSRGTGLLCRRSHLDTVTWLSLFSAVV